MKRRDRKQRAAEQPTAPSRVLGRTPEEWRAAWEIYRETSYRFCYVVGVRSIRCMKSVVRFTRVMWRPLAHLLHRAAEWLLLRHCRKLAAEWRVLRADLSVAVERVQGVQKGRTRLLLRELMTLPVLAVRRHRAMFRTLLNIATPAVAATLLIVTVSYWRQANFVLALEYDGERFGYIADEATYNKAASAVEGMVIDADDSFEVQRSPRMTLVVVPDAELLGVQEVSDRIFNRVSDSIVETAGLYVDGVFWGALPRETLEQLMAASLAKNSPNRTENASFFSQVEIVDGLYPVSAVSTEEEVAAKLDAVPVKLSQFVTYTETVKYETVVQWDESRPLGDDTVVVEGKDGEQSVTEEIVTVNGEELYRMVASTEIITPPVSKVIVKGGQKYSEDVEVGDGVATGNFVWPLPYTKVISSPFASRWGSFHGAIDISNGRVEGKPIIASDGGTVLEAGWHNSYGYYVLIDHGNGFKTRYAHCRSLNVKAGQKVAQGEYIADVGNTGYSFGAHLHFEVILNGQLVDPMNYVAY